MAALKFHGPATNEVIAEGLTMGFDARVQWLDLDCLIGSSMKPAMSVLVNLNLAIPMQAQVEMGYDFTRRDRHGTYGPNTWDGAWCDPVFPECHASKPPLRFNRTI